MAPSDGHSGASGAPCDPTGEEAAWLTMAIRQGDPWEQRRRALRGLPLRRGKPAGAALAVALLAGAWAASATWGAATPEWADVSFIAAIVAGLYFGFVGGLVGGVAALVLVSPLGPLHPPLATGAWLAHGVVAVVLGALVGIRSYRLDHSQARSVELASRMAATYHRTLHLIAEAVELRDPVTAGHSRRVAANARTLGAGVGLPDAELDALYWAGLLHDVGKIAVPESILQKPGRLSASEWELMRAHPSLGAGLIGEASPDLGALAQAVAAHHECWDGSGYPAGLAGEAIPLSGRILAIVDVFEALTSVRPYRGPLAPDEALAYVTSGRGTRFDPALVAVFERLVAEQALCLAPSPDEAATSLFADLDDAISS